MQIRRRPTVKRLRSAGALGLLLVLVSQCTGGDAKSAFDWRRQPLEAGWIAGEPPLLFYTVAEDSREQHRTVLRVLQPTQLEGFLEAAEEDPNGNAPATPGTSVSNDFWLWSPQGMAVGERYFIFVLTEDSGGDRQIERISWTDSPEVPTRAPVADSQDAVAFHAAPCGDGICLVMARTATSEATSSLVVRWLDADGEPLGDDVTTQAPAGVVLAVTAFPGAAAGDGRPTLDVLAQVCEGCEDISYDDYENDIYDVTTTFVHLAVEPGEDAPAPTALGQHGGLVEPAAFAATASGGAALYWRTAAEAAPECHPQGHCPILRELVLASWERGANTWTESAPLAASELAYARALTASGNQLWAAWREEDAVDPWRRTLFVAPLAADGSVALTPLELAQTYAPELYATEVSASPAALPFGAVDSLSLAPGTDEGAWLAMRYRDLRALYGNRCDHAARAGIWGIQIAAGGAVSGPTEDAESLAYEATCSEGGGCTAGRGTPEGTGMLVPVWLGLVLGFAWRRRRGAKSRPA